jgi:hypothetical protein
MFLRYCRKTPVRYAPLLDSDSRPIKQIGENKGIDYGKKQISAVGIFKTNSFIFNGCTYKIKHTKLVGFYLLRR